MTQFVLAGVLGVLFALGTFLVLRRDIVRVIWGVTIISQSANVYLVTMGGLSGGVPILGHGAHAGAEHVTDPLVQALVLTAIVIGFALTVILAALALRAWGGHGSLRSDEMTSARAMGDPTSPTPDHDR